MTNIAFVDCETTHLDASIGVAWEVAVILREFEDDRHTDTEYVWQIRPNLDTADPEALRIGRFEERFAVPPGAEAAWTADESGHVAPMTRREAVTAIVNVLSSAVIVGSNPSFDDRHLRRLVGRGRAKWHYRPYDIVQLAAMKIGIEFAGRLPWSSRKLSYAVGVQPPAEDTAHTALGDARWARDVYDAAMAPEPVEFNWEGRARHAVDQYARVAVELEDTERERDEHKKNYLSACGTIAAMHKAAVGEVRGPHRGVVEDVEDVRERAEKIRKALHVHLHALRARPGREITTDFVRAVLERLIEHPDETCNLADPPAAPLPDGFQREACVTAKCAVCEYEFDEDESSTIHFEDLDTAHVTLRGYDWTILADGRALCPTEDSEHQALREPSDAPSPPVSPDQTALDVNDQDDDEPEETGDADGDVFALISEIAGRLRDATDGGEYHAVGLIADLANGRTTIADARTELAEITFRHV